MSSSDMKEEGCCSLLASFFFSRGKELHQTFYDDIDFLHRLMLLRD